MSDDRPTLELSLPWESAYASSNERHGGDRPFSHTERYRSARDFIWAAANNAKVGNNWPLDAEYRVEVVTYPPDRRRRDPSNVPKHVLDALQGALYEDDYQVRVGAWRREPPDPDEPRIVVTVEVLPDEPDP